MFVPHRQRLEITVDILQGCAHSCAGCMINQGISVDLEDMKLIRQLSQDFAEAGYTLFDFSVGATDVMSATNTDSVFTNSAVLDLISIYGAFTLNAAFLDKEFTHYKELANLIDRVAPGKPVRFLIPAAPNSFKNGKFGSGVSERLDLVNRALTSANIHESGFVVNCTAETLIGDAIQNLNKCFDSTFTVKKDDILNIPYGRIQNKDLLTAEKVKRISHQISNFYSNVEGDGERFENPDLCPDTGTMLNLQYSEGRLYWIPFLKDECVFIDPAFEIKRPWTVESVLETRYLAMLGSLDYLDKTPCMECEYLTSCMEKGITSIMQTLSIKECLVGL